jgi:hypothetical protein
VLDFSQRRKADALGLNLAAFLTGVLLSVAATGGWARAPLWPPENSH